LELQEAPLSFTARYRDDSTVATAITKGIIMKNIVITGGTRGIGYGLAKAFLDLDCAVMLSGLLRISLATLCPPAFTSPV